MGMRWFAFIFGSLLVPMALFSQSPLKNAVQLLTYRVAAGSGTNACAVAYNPADGLYYTAFAGNPSYPLEAFDANGKTRYSGEIGTDIRSLWYNEKHHTLEGLGYPMRNRFTVTLNASGEPTGLKPPTRDVPSIPNTQSVAFNAGKPGLLFFDGRTVYRLKPSNLKLRERILLKGIPGDRANLNFTSMAYTGVKGYELAFYEPSEANVYYTDLKGNHTGTTRIPGRAPDAGMFRFSYANRLLWLYDVDERTWHGYRVF